MTVTTAADPYLTLGVARSASAEEIKHAYRQLALTVHPDAGGDPDTFRAVHEAYDVLSAPARRAEFDRSQAVTQPPAWRPAAPGENGQPYQHTFVDPDSPWSAQRPTPPPSWDVRPMPGSAGHDRPPSYPGLRFSSRVNMNLITVRAAFAGVVFLACALRQVPLNALLSHFGVHATAAQLPLIVPVVLAVAAFVFGVRIWMWSTTPGNRWKSAIAVASLFLFEALLAAAVLTAVLVFAVSTAVVMLTGGSVVRHFRR